VRRLHPAPAEIDDVRAFVTEADRPAPPGRPWLLVNMISSLDGAVTLDGRSGGLGRPADKAMLGALRSACDVVLVGAGTARIEGYGPPRAAPEVRAARIERGQAEVPRLVVVSRSLAIDPAARFLAEAEVPPVIVTCAGAPADRRAALEPVAALLVAGDDDVDLPAALAELADDGVGTVCCEGGPELNGALLAADLVDEWALTLSPLLVGAGPGRAVAGAPVPDPAAFALSWVLEGDGLLLTRWLRAR